MECDSYVENGGGCIQAVPQGLWSCGFRGDVGYGSVRGVRLDFAVSVPRSPARAARCAADSPRLPATASHPADPPFMNNMDEISYWIYTKRAPCLMNYDNLLKKQNEEAQCSKEKIKSVQSVPEEVASPKKKKKRKLNLLDDDSISTEKQQNVYFDTSQQQNQPTVLSSCKSDTMGSNIDFNIKNSSVQGKPNKRMKLQKNSRTTLHKKNKIVTSTPKTTTLRRSLRKTQRAQNGNGLCNNSIEMLNASPVNGNYKCSIATPAKTLNKSTEKTKKSAEKLANGNSTNNMKNDIPEQSKPQEMNGQFEDLSDVSGFTANYIRSTKMQSKTPRKLKNKVNRNLVKESKESIPKEDIMVMCVNKAMNTGVSKGAVLNDSTDSSHNVINLVTTDINGKPTRVSRSTSLLKFMEMQKNNKESVTRNRSSRTNKNLDASFQSNNTPATPRRYPKRHKTMLTNTPADSNQTDDSANASPDKQKPIDRDLKENPEEKRLSRTRSGRKIGSTVCQPVNSVLVLSNSTEQVSSAVTMNVGSPEHSLRNNTKKKRVTSRSRGRKTIDNSGRKNSLRDKSGFAACFSDSDDDKPLKQKFFC